MSINRAVLVGRLTRDPEMRSTASGMSVLSMRLAFNDRRKNPQTGEWEDMSNYIDATLFGKRAEALSRFLTKGTRIGIDGRLRWSEWESQSGEKRSKIEVIADELELLDSRDAGGQGGQSGGGSGTGGGAAPSSGDDLEGEEIPF
jgi:single-strand DNA-binding protein